MNVLAIGAHFDDVELGCGASLKKLKEAGHSIYIYVGTTSGFVTVSSRDTVRMDDAARKEGERTARMIGATLITGDAPTFALNYTPQINTTITKLVEELNIDLVFIHWGEDPHHDHWGLAMATNHGAKHVPRVLAYQSSWYEGQSAFVPNFYIDVSDWMPFKRELLKVFESEYCRVGEKWDAFCESTARIYGLKNGCQYAEGFQCIRWLY